MLQLVVPLLAVALCLGVGALALGGPAPVVVVGAPPLPATGAYDGPVELTFTLTAAEDRRGAVLEVRDPSGAVRPVRRELSAGAARVVVDQPGEHVLDWEVVCAGAATRGSTVVRVA